jgi:hypothetical protein
LEGNIGGEDLKTSRLVPISNVTRIISWINSGIKVQFLDLSNIKVKHVIRPACSLFGTTRVLETENMKAILSILTAIISNQSSISHLLSLSLQNVEYNEDIGKKITEILKANKI